MNRLDHEILAAMASLSLAHGCWHSLEEIGTQMGTSATAADLEWELLVLENASLVAYNNGRWSLRRD